MITLRVGISISQELQTLISSCKKFWKPIGKDEKDHCIKI